MLSGVARKTNACLEGRLDFEERFGFALIAERTLGTQGG
jgi:hypothetical protein